MAGEPTQGTGEQADRALEQLAEELHRTATRLTELGRRAEDLRQRRREGSAWDELVAGEARPLVVEQLAQVLDRLGESSAQFRRAEAQALAAHGLSHARIARLFGVTRQRVGALLAHGQDPRP